MVDLDLDRARRLHPVVIDVPGTGGRPYGLSDLERDGAHLVRFGSAHPILERPSDGGAELQRVHSPDNARELGRQRPLQLRLHPLALLQPLGDHHGLGEKVVGKLNVEGQIEPYGTLPDIGAPVVHVLVALQELVHPGRDILGCVDRSVLGQLQVHEQLGPVGGREELLRDEARTIQRRSEQAQRDEDGDPSCSHRQHQEAAECAHDWTGLPRVRCPGFLENPDADQR